MTTPETVSVNGRPNRAATDEFGWELPAEAITVRIRWFGLCVGYVLVNFLGPHRNQPELNGILTLGAVYALLDTVWSLRGKVFLGRLPLFISLMEAVFIGLLCYFDNGLDSLFRYYYFLSLLVCAIRYSPAVTYATFLLHAISFTILSVSSGAGGAGQTQALLLMLIFLGWVTWASTSLATLMKAAGRKLSELNAELQSNQALLEQRIDARTRELQESQALLLQQEKQAAFGLLAAGIAHEVGNPLAAISSLVQMMNRRDLDDYMHERLGMVDDQLRRIQRTLRELVDFSRPASKDIVQCDIHEIIESALSVAKYYKRRKGKEIATRFTPDAPRVAVVRDLLLQVLLNLILNSLDATEEGGRIEITTAVSEDSLDIEVADDGHGIAPGDQSRLFEPYFTTKATGTGLGLFVCRNIMEAFRGRIELVKSSKEGTTFRLSLPIDPAAPPVKHAPAASATAPSSEPSAHL
ncbi:MAG: two-component sensor histidine kinase [Planctomycetota bacterium]|nr:MAG: two-component sensor histidine kinase [Planctomycetota bacterium]REK24202.1 MAG: two-component sensor histidine kinase [Planctomycetota bacterium]REK28810.1 MAG: two-component sensor histidine kinase [Planctomycetota bacterium]